MQHVKNVEVYLCVKYVDYIWGLVCPLLSGLRSTGTSHVASLGITYQVLFPWLSPRVEGLVQSME